MIYVIYLNVKKSVIYIVYLTSKFRSVLHNPTRYFRFLVKKRLLDASFSLGHGFWLFHQSIVFFLLEINLSFLHHKCFFLSLNLIAPFVSLIWSISVVFWIVFWISLFPALGAIIHLCWSSLRTWSFEALFLLCLCY